MKKIFVILALTLLVLSAGCAQIGKKDEGKETAKKFYFTGTDGLAITFDEDKPPKINYREDPIEIMLRVVNKGMVDLAAGEVKARLRGVVAEEIFQPDTLEASSEEELPAVELGTPSITSIDLGTITYSPEEMYRQEYPVEVEVEVCYPYKTVVSTYNFWISDKQEDLDKGKISTSDNSAGPIKTHSLKEYRQKDKIKFEFIVENKGKGKAVESCWPEDGDKEIVQIKISGDARCNVDNDEIKLISGKKIVTCEIPSRGEDQSFQIPFEMELSYNYDEQLSKEITIKNTELMSEF